MWFRESGSMWKVRYQFSRWRMWWFSRSRGNSKDCWELQTIIIINNILPLHQIALLKKWSTSIHHRLRGSKGCLCHSNIRHTSHLLCSLIIDLRFLTTNSTCKLPRINGTINNSIIKITSKSNTYSISIKAAVFSSRVDYRRLFLRLNTFSSECKVSVKPMRTPRCLLMWTTIRN